MGNGQDIAAVRRFWDHRPCNVFHSPSAFGSPEWSEGVSARRYFIEPHIREFADFPHWNGKRVLEIGCGIGSDALEFARAGAKVAAIDLSRRSAEVAQERLCGHSDAGVFVGNAEVWLPPGTFDLIYSFGALHHTPNPERVLERAYRSVRPGGELRVMLYARWALKRVLGQQYEAQAGCPLIRFYTKREARGLIRRAGFRVESISKRFIFQWRVQDYVNRSYVKHAAFRWLPRPAMGLLERALGQHLLIVARRPVRSFTHSNELRWAF